MPDSTLWSVKIKNRSSPLEVFLGKSVLKTMQQIYRRTTMLKCNFNKVANQLYWNCTLAWVFSCRFDAYFKSTFYNNTSGWLLLKEEHLYETDWNDQCFHKKHRDIHQAFWFIYTYLFQEESCESISLKFRPNIFLNKSMLAFLWKITC